MDFEEYQPLTRVAVAQPLPKKRLTKIKPTQVVGFCFRVVNCMGAVVR